MNNVPIMEDAGILFCQDFIRSHNVINILEIGTAVAYWSIAMASLDPNIRITTIEFSHARYLEAMSNVKSFGLENQIDCVWMDAKDYHILFPIPQKALNENSNLKQNPGYEN